MSSINSLVGRAPTTFLSSSGPTNTWLDDYIDNPNYRHSSLFSNDKDIFHSSSRRPDLSNQGYRTLELRPGMDGFSGPPTLEKLPNYNPDNDPGITKMARATDPEWLNIIRLLTGQ